MIIYGVEREHMSGTEWYSTLSNTEATLTREGYTKIDDMDMDHCSKAFWRKEAKPDPDFPDCNWLAGVSRAYITWIKTQD